MVPTRLAGRRRCASWLKRAGVLRLDQLQGTPAALHAFQPTGRSRQVPSARLRRYYEPIRELFRTTLGQVRSAAGCLLGCTSGYSFCCWC